MKAVIDFWVFFIKMMLGVLALGVALCGPPALLWWLVGPVAACIAFGVLLIGYCSGAVWWDDHPRRTRGLT
jgi:hypothetical protein